MPAMVPESNLKEALSSPEASSLLEPAPSPRALDADSSELPKRLLLISLPVGRSTPPVEEGDTVVNRSSDALEVRDERLSRSLEAELSSEDDEETVEEVDDGELDKDAASLDREDEGDCSEEAELELDASMELDTKDSLEALISVLDCSAEDNVAEEATAKAVVGTMEAGPTDASPTAGAFCGRLQPPDRGLPSGKTVRFVGVLTRASWQSQM